MTGKLTTDTHTEVLIGLNALAMFQQGQIGAESAAYCLERSREALDTALASCRAQQDAEVVPHG